LTADVITGATGSFTSNGGSNTFSINHSSGAGIALNITKGGNNEGLYINKTSGSGNAATIVGTLEATTLVKTGGTSSQFLKADGSVDSSGYVTGSGSAGRVAFWDGVSNITSDANLYWDSSTDRLGIGSNTPNASLGILNASSTGIQVRTSDSANQYQANIFYDASYGMVYGYNRLGTGTASNLTFFNNIGGFLSIPESATNNIGFNTLNPQGLAGASVYDFTSLNTNVELRLHNSSTGYTSTDGSFIRATSTALVIANAESSQSIFINNGGLEVITINGTNKVAIGSVGVVPLTQQLTVIGSIEAYGGSIYQTVTSSMLKANASGQIIAAIAGTDYLAAGSAVTSVSATSPVLSSGGITPNISIPAATTSVSGYLTSTDWTTFNNKGTFSLPSLTSGSVLFSNGSTIAQDNANLFWDNASNRLGIGTSSPTEILHIVGPTAIVYIDGNDGAGTQTSATLRLRTGGFNVGNFRYNIATDNIEISNVSAGALASGAVKIYGTGGSTTGLTIAAAGGGSFASTLTVGTTAYITNDIFIGDTTSGSGRFFITDSSNQGITLRRAGAADRFKLFVGNGTTYTQDNAIILGTNTDIDFYTGSSPVKRLTIANSGISTFYRTTSGTALSIYTSYASGRAANFGFGDGTILPTAAFYIGNQTGVGVFIGDETTTNGLYVKANGNVGIGTTDPTSQSTGTTTGILDVSNSSGGNLVLHRTVSGDTALFSILKGSNGTFIDSTGAATAANNAIYFRNNDNNADQTSLSTRLTIKSGGNVGIGTSNPSYLLHIPQGNNLFLGNIYISGTANNPILSSGATGGSLYLQSGGAGEGNIYLQGAAAGGNGYIQFNTNGSLRMTIASNGNIGAPSGSNIYNASDIRLKQNITTIVNGLDKIIALNPVKFNWIDGFEEPEDGKDMLGFVAQEVQNAIPEAVEGFGNSSVTIGETIIDNPLRVNEKFIIPVLVAAIKELNQTITSLQEQINELKNK
jgi:hypothetical protein